MEPISEERQRKVREWAHPELKGEHWRESHGSYGDGLYAEYDRDGIRHRFPITALYLSGVPNYQWFFTEAVPKLTTDGCYIAYGNPSCFDNKSAIWYVSHEGQKTHAGLDPIAALAEYVEAK